ncbi:hypothetical protein PIB30_087989, partial [Stylosanthes scabra]|nr:hypothetical protein [Stylosanthes scabra]
VILLDPVHLPESLLCLRKRKRKVFERSLTFFLLKLQPWRRYVREFNPQKEASFRAFHDGGPKAGPEKRNYVADISGPMSREP